MIRVEQADGHVECFPVHSSCTVGQMQSARVHCIEETFFGSMVAAYETLTIDSGKAPRNELQFYVLAKLVMGWSEFIVEESLTIVAQTFIVHFDRGKWLVIMLQETFTLGKHHHNGQDNQQGLEKMHFENDISSLINGSGMPIDL